MATYVQWMFARKSLCEADLTCATCIADMPDVAAGAPSIAFGGYMIMDRQGVRVLRDPYSAKPMCCSARPSTSGAGCRTLMRSRS
jgi:hypothetical protein